MKTTNIYILIDPVTKEVRYVGKANNVKQRYGAHLNRARKHQIHKRNWIESLKRIGLKPIIEVVDIVPINEWVFWETYWICQMKSWGFNLINYTLGGDGCTFGNQTSFKKGDNGKKVVCLNKDGLYVKTFESTLDAERCIKKRGIDSVLSKKTKTCGGFIWLYEQEYSKIGEEELKRIVDNASKMRFVQNPSNFKKGNVPWNKGAPGYKLGGKKIVKFDLSNNFIDEFNSLKEAAKSVSFVFDKKIKKGNSCLISQAIKKNKGIYKGFVWKFK